MQTVDLDLTLIWVYTGRPDMSVRKPKNITVHVEAGEYLWTKCLVLYQEFNVYRLLILCIITHLESQDNGPYQP